MHFNTKFEHNREIPRYSDNSFDNNRLALIDTITVDDNSRLTITRNLKKFVNIRPKDIIIVYQDKYNKDLLFSIQRESMVTETLIIKNNHAGNNNNKCKNIYEIVPADTFTDRLKNNNTLRDINILLVDDEKDLVKVFEIFLHKEGYYNIQTFTDPIKAIKHFVELENRHYYGLVITDIRMPEINGLQLYQILKIINPGVKVIFLTALDAVNELASLHNIGVQDIIKKPIERDNFIEIVNDTIFNTYNKHV